VRVRPSRGLAWQTIEGEAVLLDLSHGRSLGLNETASVIWSLLPDHDDEQIARELARRFDVSAERARGDVACLIRRLLERGLVEEV
jgi:predicted DNA-binding transcriptional regulator